MARNEEMERRCLNWARWHESRQGGVGYGGGGWDWSGASQGGYREARVPLLDVEAEQTDRAIKTLEWALRRTVEVYYLGQGTMQERCKDLQIARPTIYVRIDKAHEALAAWLRDVEARARHERERLALVVASARPGAGGFKR